MVSWARRRYGHWGPKKIRAYLEREAPEEAWPRAVGDGPNALWCIDFKGWFRTGDGLRCDPLTLTDAHSRYLLRCQVADGRTETVRPLVEAAFREYGLPQAIRSDNGTPFASRGIEGLSRLSVWWVKLGIRPDRIRPGKPQENGGHERRHRTLREETARPPAATGRRQQEAFDRFRHVFNHARPHEALGMRTPASVYGPSPRAYPARLGPVEYPDGVTVRAVQKHGEFYWKHEPVFLGEALGHERIGLAPIDDRYWTIWFGGLTLGVLDAPRWKVLSLSRAARLGLAAPGRTATAEGITDVVLG